MTLDPQVTTMLARVRRQSLSAAVVGIALCALGVYLDRPRFYQAYLVGYLFWWAIASGCLAVAMLHHLSGGEWGLPIRRVLEAGYATLPLLAVLFIPIALGVKTLYLWADAEQVAHDPLLQHKARYLNVEG